MAVGGSEAARLTVVICTYEAAATLRTAVESALAQTAPRESYRVLVVDDGSRDRTSQVLAGMEGIEVLRLKHNVGLPAACNVALEQISTPFFVRLDADDRFEPRLIETLLAGAERVGANLVYSDRYEVTGPERRLRSLSGKLDLGLLIAAGVLMETELVRQVGGYRPLFWEEYDLLLRLLESGRTKIAHVPEPLYSYTVGEIGAMTSDERALVNGWLELQEIWPAPVLARYGLDRSKGMPGR